MITQPIACGNGNSSTENRKLDFEVSIETEQTKKINYVDFHWINENWSYWQEAHIKSFIGIECIR